jgi:uncharacterized coiled-coil protein SlyX
VKPRKDVVLATMKIPAGTLGPNDPLPPFKLRKRKNIASTSIKMPPGWLDQRVLPSNKPRKHKAPSSIVPKSIVPIRIKQAKRIKALEGRLTSRLKRIVALETWLAEQSKRTRALEVGMRDLLVLLYARNDKAWYPENHPAVEVAYSLLVHRTASAERGSPK